MQSPPETNRNCPDDRHEAPVEVTAPLEQKKPGEQVPEHCEASAVTMPLEQYRPAGQSWVQAAVVSPVSKPLLSIPVPQEDAGLA
jgi:hypothetical protein